MSSASRPASSVTFFVWSRNPRTRSTLFCADRMRASRSAPAAVTSSVVTLRCSTLPRSASATNRPRKSLGGTLSVRTAWSSPSNASSWPNTKPPRSVTAASAAAEASSTSFATTVRSAVETSSRATPTNSPASVAPRADVSRSPAAAGGAASEASVAASSPPLQPEATNTALTNITVNHRPRMSSPFRRLPEGADRTTTEADRFPDPPHLPAPTPRRRP